MDLAILRTLISDDDFAQLGDAVLDADVLESLNREDVVVWVDRKKADVYNYLLNNGLWTKMRYTIATLTGNADTEPKMMLLVAALTAKDFFASDIEYVNGRNLMIQQMIGGFVQGGVFSQNESTAFFNQFKTYTSRAKLECGEPATQAHLDTLRLAPKIEPLNALRQAWAALYNNGMAQLDNAETAIMTGVDVPLPTRAELIGDFVS